MYNGVGLSTVRGTATSGHVQKNRSHVRAARRRQQEDRHRGKGPPSTSVVSASAREQGNREIQQHNRARELENRLLILREDLEEDGVAEDEIEKRIQEERQLVTARWKEEEEAEAINTAEEQRRTERNESEIPEEGEEIDDPVHLQVSREMAVGRRDNRTCFNCGLPGHIARHCTQPRQNRRAARLSASTNSHMERERKREANVVVAKAFGIDREQYKEGVAFDQELQKRKKAEKQAAAAAAAEKEAKKIEKQRRKEEKASKKAARKERGRKKRRRRSPSSSSSSSRQTSSSYFVVVDDV